MKKMIAMLIVLFCTTAIGIAQFNPGDTKWKGYATEGANTSYAVNPNVPNAGPNGLCNKSTMIDVGTPAIYPKTIAYLSHGDMPVPLSITFSWHVPYGAGAPRYSFTCADTTAPSTQWAYTSLYYTYASGGWQTVTVPLTSGTITKVNALFFNEHAPSPGGTGQTYIINTDEFTYNYQGYSVVIDNGSGTWNAPPAVPSVITGDGQIFTVLPACFYFTPISGILYKMKVTSDSLGVNIVQQQTGITSSPVCLYGLPNGTYWFWIAGYYSNPAYQTGWVKRKFVIQTSTGINPISGEIPKEYKLGQNYPNPFNPVTSIKFAIPKQEFVTLKVYDMLGKEVVTLVNSTKSAGNYIVDFNAAEISSGTYFYRLKAGEFTEVKKMTIIK